MFECCNVTLYKVNENKVKLNKMLLLCVQAQAGGTTLQCGPGLCSAQFLHL